MAAPAGSSEIASAERGLEEQVNRAALKPFDSWGAECAPMPKGGPNIVPFAHPAGGSSITGEIVRSICELRRRRDEVFPGKLFGDPSWDILLQLYAAHLDSLRISITRLTRLSGVPATTVLRRLGTLEDRRLLTRTIDPYDARRVYVSLSPTGVEAMERCFTASGLGTALL
jgi:DNA-binding MarR family transcriptional regulator